MARLIRRRSMERLELYDLDKFISVASADQQLPPPLPPARAHWRRPSANATLERYQFLCNTTRTKTDPIYAATPMFTTIPQSPGKAPVSRQLLGSYMRAENIHPIVVKSTERKAAPATIDQVDDEEEEDEEEQEPNERIITKSTSDNPEPPNSDGSSESSTDSDEQEDDPLLDDDDKGVIEQILNRDTKK